MGRVVSHAAAAHRDLDRQYADALARDGEVGTGHALVFLATASRTPDR